MMNRNTQKMITDARELEILLNQLAELEEAAYRLLSGVDCSIEFGGGRGTNVSAQIGNKYARAAVNDTLVDVNDRITRIILDFKKKRWRNDM